MTNRIVLSTFALLLFTAIVACATDAPLATRGAALTTPIKPCGLWIAATPALAEARHAAAPTGPDMVQLALPGGLSCSAMLAAVPAVEANWGGGHAVVYQVTAPGVAADETTVEVELDGDGGVDNGIGTSPSGPRDPGLSQF